MSATDKGAAGVETEGERPVREQLKNAKIDALHEEGTARPDDDKKVEDTEIVEATEMTEVDQPQQNGTVKTSDMSDRGRLPRKRSFDDIETPGKPTSSSHRRKRSRDSTNEDKASIKSRASLEEARQGDDGLSSDGHLTNGSKDALPSTPPSDKANESTLEDVASPKTKRSRLEDTRSNGNEESVSIPAQSSQSMSDAPEVKDSEATAKDVSAESETTTSVEKADAPPLSKGFSDTGTASPFGRLAESKSPALQPQTSSSAFASSGFGALAGASGSGFGSLGKTGLSSFASPGKEKSVIEPAEATKPASTSAFGGALGATSVFASGNGSAFGGSSGFGKIGSGGFGGGFGGGAGGFGGSTASKLSSFAGPASNTIGSSAKPVKAFGAPVEEAEEGSGDEEDGAEAGVKSPKDHEEKKDERFYAQDLETGEENETTEYSCRAKLYNFVTAENDKKEWKERGLGTVRLNVLNPTEAELAEDVDPVTKARLVMRAEGSHRVILNTPIKKELKFGTVSGEPPTGGYMYFMGSIDGQPKLEMLQLKMRQMFAIELYDRIVALQEEM